MRLLGVGSVERPHEKQRYCLVGRSDDLDLLLFHLSFGYNVFSKVERLQDCKIGSSGG